MRVIAQVLNPQVDPLEPIDGSSKWAPVDGNIKMPDGNVTDTLWQQGGVSNDVFRLSDGTNPTDDFRKNPNKIFVERALPY